MQITEKKAYYHLPGLFEHYDFYKVFLPLYQKRRDFFYDGCEIASIYGAPHDCLWAGGRIENGTAAANDVLALTAAYGISARLTLSNSLLREEHLSDADCNALCARFAQAGAGTNGVIVHSDLLLHYLQKAYPTLYFVSSTTKVLTDFEAFRAELDRDAFRFVVPDFRHNKSFDKLAALTRAEKDKTEFLCNECCDFGCTDRRACYEAVSRAVLGENSPAHVCSSRNASGGYRFSAAMRNPGFIGVDDIRGTYLPMGFSQFKIEGRSLGSALLLEFILHYMTKPEYQLQVREELYLSNALDLF